MKDFDLILFDLDGTLTRSDPGILRCIRETMKKLNVPEPPAETMRKFIGPPLTLSIREYCGITGEKAMEFVEEYRSIYNVKGVFEAEVFDGMFPLLKKLREASYKLALATSKPQSSANLVSDHFGITPYLDMVSGASEDEKDTKANVIRRAIAAMNTTASRTLMIGDTRFDAEGAQQAKTHFLGVLYGYGTREEMEAFGAVHFVDTPEDIGKWILEE